MSVRRVPIYSRKYPGLIALVDEGDFERVNDYRWHPRPPASGGHTFYARAYVDGRYERMHRFILGLSPGDPWVDHINGNGLDNRRSNLRICTNSQNQANQTRVRKGTSSQYRGVYLQKSTGTWIARIRVQGERVYLGAFADERAAALAYDRAAREHFGEFARTNFSEDRDQAA